MKTCSKCNQPIKESYWIDIPELGIQVERDVHDKDKSWQDLGLSYDRKDLLTVEQCIWLANSKYAKDLKMDGSSSDDDFFIQQPFELNKKNNYLARFIANSDWANLDCDRYAENRNASLGVRYVRPLPKGKKKELQ